MPQEPENTTPDVSKKPESQRGGLSLRIVGAMLVVAAILLYVHDLAAARRRSSGANAVRYVAGASVLGLGIRATPGEDSLDPALYEPCSTDVAADILAKLAEAEPVKSPALERFARSYDMFLFLTNRTRVFLRARRDEGSDTAYVSLREPRRSSAFGAKEGAVSFVEFPAAGVRGLGAVFDEIDSGRLSALRGARPVPAPGARAWTNLVRRAGVAGLTEETVAHTWSALRAMAGSGAVKGAGVVRGPLVSTQRPMLKSVPPGSLAAILEALSGAEAAETPQGTFEGEEFGLLLILSDGYAANVRAAVPASDPDDALLGFVDAAPPEAGETTPRLKVTEPARVRGLGAILKAAVEASGGESADAEAPGAGD